MSSTTVIDVDSTEATVTEPATPDTELTSDIDAELAVAAAVELDDWLEAAEKLPEAPAKSKRQRAKAQPAADDIVAATAADTVGETPAEPTTEVVQPAPEQPADVEPIDLTKVAFVFHSAETGASRTVVAADIVAVTKGKVVTVGIKNERKVEGGIVHVKRSMGKDAAGQPQFKINPIQATETAEELRLRLIALGVTVSEKAPKTEAAAGDKPRTARASGPKAEKAPKEPKAPREPRAAKPKKVTALKAVLPLPEKIDLVLVACGGRKQDHDTPAGEMFTGPYTQAAIKTALHIAGGDAKKVRILSSKHGLVKLDQVISTYDLPMGAEGSTTGEDVVKQAKAQQLSSRKGVVLFGGGKYVTAARAVWPELVAPVAGAGGIGSQMAAMKQIRGEAGV